MGWDRLAGTGVATAQKIVQEHYTFRIERKVKVKSRNMNMAWWIFDGDNVLLAYNGNIGRQWLNFITVRCSLMHDHDDDYSCGSTVAVPDDGDDGGGGDD